MDINIPRHASFIVLEGVGHPEVEGQYKVTITEMFTVTEAVFPAFSEEWTINFLNFINKYINQNNPNILFDGRSLDIELDESKPSAISDRSDEISTNSKSEEEALIEDILLEGSIREILVNVYERNQVARRICIEHYGPTCVICGLNFGEKYGDIVRNFIHVHHITPLSQIKEEYQIDPIEDLRPVCPNCHSVDS